MRSTPSAVTIAGTIFAPLRPWSSATQTAGASPIAWISSVVTMGVAVVVGIAHQGSFALQPVYVNVHLTVLVSSAVRMGAVAAVEIAPLDSFATATASVSASQIVPGSSVAMMVAAGVVATVPQSSSAMRMVSVRRNV